MLLARTFAAAAVIAAVSLPVHADSHGDKAGLFTYKAMTVDLALQAAKAAMESCRAAGYQVTVAVVDRAGVTQVLLRDRFAGALTPRSAEGKARTAVSFREDTAMLVRKTGAATPQAGARDIPGALMLGGGVKVDAAGTIVGAIGVSGAPSGEADAACANAGIDAISDSLQF